MPRRFRRGFRRRTGAPFQRVNRAWVNAVFVESPIDTSTAAVQEMVILEPDDWKAGNTSNTRQHTLVERIIVTGSMSWVPQTTTLASNIAPIAAAVYVLDDEAASDETQLWTTGVTQSIPTNAERFLWSKYRSFSIIELTGSAASTGGSPNQFEVEVDIKVKVKVDLESLIVLGLQWANDVSSTVALSSFSGLARALVRLP